MILALIGTAALIALILKTAVRCDLEDDNGQNS